MSQGYGTTIAICQVCGIELDTCPAWFDGEPTCVGYYSCPKHPNAGADYQQLMDYECKNKEDQDCHEEGHVQNHR